MSNFDFPGSAQVVGEDRFMTVAWGQWFTRVQAIVSSVQQSGVTADRPTAVLWIGRRFFDTTLNKPVYVRSIRPTVWVDGVGTVS